MNSHTDCFCIVRTVPTLLPRTDAHASLSPVCKGIYFSVVFDACTTSERMVLYVLLCETEADSVGGGVGLL